MIGVAVSPCLPVCRKKTGGGVVTPPDQPSTFNLSSPSHTEVSASWHDVPGVDGYQVQLSTHADFSVLYRDTNTTGTSCGFSFLSEGTLFYGRVRAYIDEVYSTWKTGSVSTGGGMSIPATPTSFAAGNSLSDHINLSWVQSPSGTGYKVYRVNWETEEQVLIATLGNVDAYEDWDVEPGVVYTYYLTATNNAGASAAAGPADGSLAAWETNGGDSWQWNDGSLIPQN